MQSDRVLEEGHPLGRGVPSVLGDRGPGRELPDRGVLDLCHSAGRTLIDRELYLPKSWTDDRDRCAQAGVPTEREFATKPLLAIAMLERAVAAGVPGRWVTGDSVYGWVHRLRARCEQLELSYVPTTVCWLLAFLTVTRSRRGPENPATTAS